MRGTTRGPGVLRQFLSVLVAGILLVGCGSAVSTVPIVPTLGSSAIRATSSPGAPSSPPSTTAGSHLTYVALGDSLLYALEECDRCTSSVVIYGKRMATDLGMPVEVHNLTMHNGPKSDGLLAYLTDGTEIGRNPEDVLKAVARADVVSVTIGYNDFSFAETGSVPTVMQAFEMHLDAILRRIVDLRAGKPTVIRVTQIYNNGIGPTPASDPDGAGTGVSVWKPIVEERNRVICREAAKYMATCVDICHPFNGDDGLSSPIAKGYLGADGTHPSQVSMDTIADALVSSGYAPLR